MRQLLFGRWTGNLVYAASGIAALTQYGTLGSSNRFTAASASNSFLSWPISAPGTFSKVKITLKASPAEALEELGDPVEERRFRFNLYVNDVLQFTVQVTENETVGSYEGAAITVAAGDRMKWECIPNPHFGQYVNTFNMPDIIQSCVFTSTQTGVSIYFSRDVTGDQLTRYNGVFNGHDSWSNTPATAANVIRVPGNLTRFDVLADPAANPGWGSVVFSIRLSVDGVTWVNQDGTGGTTDTRVTLTEPATSATWTGSLRVDPSTHLLIQLMATAAGNFPRTSRCFKFVADTDGKFWLGGFNGILPSNSALEYQIPTANGIDHDWEPTAPRKSLIGALVPLTLEDFRVWHFSPPGVGKSRTYDNLVDGVATDAVVVLSDAQTYNDIQASFLVGVNETWTMRQTPSGTPSGASDGIAWSYVATLEDVHFEEAAGIIGPLVWVEWPRRIPDDDPPGSPA